MAVGGANNDMAAIRAEIIDIARNIDQLLVNIHQQTTAERTVALNDLDRQNDYLRRTIDTSHEYEHRLMRRNWDNIQEVRRHIATEERHQKQQARRGNSQRQDQREPIGQAIGIGALGLFVGVVALIIIAAIR